MKTVLVQKKTSSNLKTHFYQWFLTVCLSMLNPLSASLSIKHSSSLFSLSLCLGCFIAHELQTQCPQGAIILQCQRPLGALGWVTLDVNGIFEIPYCVFSLEFVHLSQSCSGEGKQQRSMTSNPAKTPNWLQD